MKKVRMFVDHSNFCAEWKRAGQSSNFDKWETLADIIVRKMADKKIVEIDHCEMRGMTVYASVKPSEQSDIERKQERWLRQTLDGYQGVTVDISDKRKNGGAWQEKGVDTKLVCDMLVWGMKGLYDIGVVFSADEDIAPGILCVQDDMDKQIVHVGFRGSGTHIRSAAWSHIYLDDLKHELGFEEASE